MWRWFPIAMSCAFGAPASAQGLISDPAFFRSPALFVTPKHPADALKQAEEITYNATIEIDSFGRAASLARLEPDHAEFRAHLLDAMPLWQFYPTIDRETCEALKGEARIEMQYRRDADEPRVWVHADPMGRLLNARPPWPIAPPGLPPYPRDELRKRMEGRVYVVVTIGSSGNVEDARVLVGLPPSPGFVATAIAGAKDLRFDAGTAPRRCAIQEYLFKLR